MKRFLLACLLLLAAMPAFAQTALSFSSAPGDWVGDGATKSYSSSNATMTFTGTREAIHAHVRGNDGIVWTLDFQAPVQRVLEPGEYAYAERAGNMTGRSPGLEFNGNGRGCNRLDGRFSIRQIQFDSAGKLTRLEAVAVQYCDGSDKPLALDVRYRASYYMFGVDSARDDRVGMGIKLNWYNDTSTFTGHNSSPSDFAYNVSGMGIRWGVFIANPPGKTRFAKGSFYTLIEPSGAYGGLIVSNDFRQCEVSSGSVNILEVVYGPNDRIDKFYADFIHYCESTTRFGPSMKGRIRYVRGL